MLDICAAAQVTRNGAWWRYVEKIKGQYDFSNIAAWVSHINTCGSSGNGTVGMNFVLNGGNHLYGGKDSDSPKSAAQIQGYTNFVVAVASHFAGKGIIWELYNEPDLSVRDITAAQYATLVISVGKAIRANPTTRAEILMGPSVSEMSCSYMTSMKQLGVLNYVDAVSVHAYVSGAPEQAHWQFAAIKEIIGPGTALVSGEWGWATCTSSSGAPINCIGGTMPDVVSQTDQAMYVARQWLGNALLRVPMSIYYEWMNDDDDKAQCESNWGLRNANNGAPKPAYHAAVTVQSLVGKRPFLSQLSGGGDPKMEYILAFGPNGNGPPPVAAAGLEAGSAEVFAVWTLSTVGGTATMTGSRDNAFCGGNALWTGMATDCKAKCTSTAGCRGYVSYDTGSVHSNSNCQLTGSRCTIPRPVSGCGINIWRQQCPGGPSVGEGANQTERVGGDLAPPADPACKSAKAYTLLQSSAPPPVVFALPAGVLSKCYSVFDVLGAPLPELCAGGDGKVTVHATESPVYLVGKSAPAPTPPTPGPPPPPPTPPSGGKFACIEHDWSCVESAMGTMTQEQCLSTCKPPAPTPASKCPGGSYSACVKICTGSGEPELQCEQACGKLCP
jgi:hypothetical protein